MANYRMAVQQRDDFPEAYTSMGKLYLSTGQLKEAREALDQALYRRPDDPWVLYHFGLLYIELEDPIQAQAYLHKSLEHATSDGDLRELVQQSLKSINEP
jgi:predicted Zn-dependent protease